MATNDELLKVYQKRRGINTSSASNTNDDDKTSKLKALYESRHKTVSKSDSMRDLITTSNTDYYLKHEEESRYQQPITEPFKKTISTYKSNTTGKQYNSLDEMKSDYNSMKSELDDVLKFSSGQKVDKSHVEMVNNLKSKLSDLEKEIDEATVSDIVKNNGATKPNFIKQTTEGVKPYELNIQSDNVAMYMTDTETAMYDYLYKNKGKEDAEDYYKSIEDSLYQRQGQKKADLFGDDYIALTLPYMVGSGVKQAAEGIKQDVLRGFGITDSVKSSTPYATQYLRNNMNTGQKVLADTAYSLGYMAPAVAIGAVTGMPVVGAAALGSSSAGNAYTQARQEGKSDKEALVYGALTGSSEGALSYLLGGIKAVGGQGASKLLESSTVKSVLSKLSKSPAIQELAASMGSEFSEEYLQDILTPVYRNIAFDENNKFKPFTESAMYSGLLGALTAGVFEGPSTVSTSMYGKSVNENSEDTEAYKKYALSMDANTATRKLAEEMVDREMAGNKVSTYQLGKLASRVNSDIANNNSIDRFNSFKTTKANELLSDQPNVTSEQKVSTVGNKVSSELVKSGMDSSSASVISKMYDGTYTDADYVNIAKNPQVKLAFQKLTGLDLGTTKAEVKATAKKLSETTSNTVSNSTNEELNTESRINAVNKKYEQPEYTETPTGETLGTEAVWKGVDGTVTVKGVSKNNNGRVILAIDKDGTETTANADSIQFKDKKTELVYSIASNYGTSGSKAFVSSFHNNARLDDYSGAFSGLYQAGLTGRSMESGKNAYFAKLPNDVKQMVEKTAYQSGQNDAAEKIQKKNPVPQKEGGVIDSPAAKKMDKVQRDGLHAVGKAFGVRFHIVDSIDGANGSFSPKTGEITIALDSKDDAYLYVADHEMTHYIQQYSPELYVQLRNFVVNEIYKNDKSTLDKLIEEQMQGYANQGIYKDYEGAMDEVVANACQDFLTDPSLAKRMVDKNQSLAKRILDFITDAISKLQKAMKGISTNSMANSLLKKNMDIYKKAREMWYDALNNTHVTFTAEDGVSFQLRNLDDKSNFEQLIKENQKLKETNEYLISQMKLTKEIGINKDDIRKTANQILRQYNSQYSKDDFIYNLTNLCEYIANAEHVDGEEVMSATMSMARQIINESRTLDTTMRDMYSDLRSSIQNTQLKISDNDKADLEKYDGYNNFRRINFGRMKLGNTGLSVDTFYQELIEQYPELFEADITHPADQLIRISEVMEMTNPVYVNEYGMNNDEVASYLAYKIYDSYFDIRHDGKTYADKKLAEIQRLKGHYKRRIFELRNDYKDKYDRRLAQVKEKNKDTLDALKDKYKNATQKQKEEFKEIEKRLRNNNIDRLKAQQDRYKEKIENSREKRIERNNTNKHREHIKKITKKLSDMLLFPTNERHVPQEFRKAILDVCKMLDFDTGRTNPDGTPTKVSEKLLVLKDQYKQLGENEDFISFFDEDMEVSIQELGDIVQDKTVYELNANELKRLDEIMKQIYHMVTNKNKMFIEGKKATVQEYGDKVLLEQGSKRPFKRLTVVENNKLIRSFGDMLNSGMVKPYYFFKQLGGTMQELYQNIRNGEENYVTKIQDSSEFAKDMMNRYHYKDWGLNDKTQDFITTSGNVVPLSLGEKLYIYMVNKREQGRKHMVGNEAGGIVPSRKKIIKKIISYTYESSNAVKINEQDIEKIESELTEEQKIFAEEMGKYLSDECSKWGNDITMKLYGIEKYNEKNYIPLNSADNFLFKKIGNMTDGIIKKAGFTKKLVQKANNPIIAADFLQVWAKHVNDMAMYNSFVLPLEDFQRIWNYTTKNENKTPLSVRTYIQNAYGERANEYIETLLKNINGGVIPDNNLALANHLVALGKKGAVAANLSVAIQQPSSLARVFAIIDPKYFVQTAFSKKDYDELMRYVPAAVLKKHGYFDTAIGQSASDILTAVDYNTPLEKIKGFFTDSQVRDEVFTWLPEKMDEITWSTIWNAVKKETNDKHPGLSGDAFYEQCKKRMVEIIDRTQVMDSVFQRSQLMRSKDGFAKTATAFMSEPMVTYNMIRDALISLKSGETGSRLYFTRALGSVVAAAVLNSILKSFVSALRDDDDKEFADKYTEAFITNLSDDPLQMIPYVKDAVSIFKGYNVTRPEMQVVQSIYYSYSRLDNDDYSEAEKISGMAESISALFGIPAKNIHRDIASVYSNMHTMLQDMGVLYKPTDYEELKSKYDIAKKDSDGNYNSYVSGMYYQALFNAKLSGDKDLYNTIYNDLIKSGRDKSSIDTSLKSRENNLFTKLYDAKVSGDTKEYKKIYNQLLTYGRGSEYIDSVIRSKEYMAKSK